MALKLSFVLFLSILVASVSLLASAADLGDRQAPVPGGWLDIDPNNPQVVEFAKFAVSEHNREAKTTLQFVKVINVKGLISIGVSYKLVISAKVSNKSSTTNEYEAVVSQSSYGAPLKLDYFRARLD